MLRISEEDYRILELKIKTEVKKIFAEFLEDLERKNADSSDRVTGQEHGEQLKPEPAESARAATVARKRHVSRKFTEIGKSLGSPASSGPKSSGRILEENMEKIFRKKARRGAN